MLVDTFRFPKKNGLPRLASSSYQQVLGRFSTPEPAQHRGIADEPSRGPFRAAASLTAKGTKIFYFRGSKRWV